MHDAESLTNSTRWPRVGYVGLWHDVCTAILCWRAPVCPVPSLRKLPHGIHHESSFVLSEVEPACRPRRR